MYLDNNSPSEICAVVETTTRKRKADQGSKTTKASPSAQITGKRAKVPSHSITSAPAAGSPIASDAASEATMPIFETPIAGNPIADGQNFSGPHYSSAIGSPNPDTATHESHPNVGAPYPGTHPTHHEAIDTIVEYYRLRQDMIRARTKLILQAQASLRRVFDGDKEMAAKVYAEAAKDTEHAYSGQISPYLASLAVLDKQQSEYEKAMLRAMKPLPILQWARDVKGLGDMSLACIIGEASGYRNDDGSFYSVGDFKSVSALWKRMGLAVLNGHRQGNPGKGASAEDWITEGYSRSRRSVMWNVGNSLILSMGKFRPIFGEDVDANAEYTYLQKVFANRARYEQAKLGKEVAESKTGKDSYSAHAANRAKRYTEKRLLRMLYAEWRRCMA